MNGPRENAYVLVLTWASLAAAGDCTRGLDRKGAVAVKKIRIGASNHFAARPLLFGLMEDASDRLELVFGESGTLALWLERGDLEAALIPSIEFLRGVGHHAIRGASLVAEGRTTNYSLVSRVPLEAVKRVAVDEFSRTPLVALRAVLDKRFGAMPDLCVVKQRPLAESAWRESFDAVLLDEDESLVQASRGERPGETCYDVGAMWRSLYACPLVVSLWACNDETLARELEPILVSSRNRGLKNLRAICESVARATSHDRDLLYQCFSTAWSYDLGPEEEEGLRVLETVASAYQVLQGHRLEKVVTA